MGIPMGHGDGGQRSAELSEHLFVSAVRPRRAERQNVPAGTDLSYPIRTVERMSESAEPFPDADRHLDDLAADICARAAGIAIATSQLLTLIAEFDRREGWSGYGIRSCAHWLAWRCGLSPGAAREHVRVARALTALPAIAASFTAGQLSYSKVRAVTLIADQDTEADLLELAVAGTAAQVERVVRAWRRVDTLTATDEAEKREVRWYYDDDGMLVLRARLAAEEGALLITALTASAETAKGEAPPVVPGVDDDPAAFPRERPVARVADALVDVARRSLDPDPHRRTSSNRHLVVVHVDAAILADDTAAGQACLEDGVAITPTRARRIACDASLVVVLRSSGDVLDVGRSRRSIPASMKRALWARDKHCQWPTCEESRRDRVEGHHIWFWAHGGTTSLRNLALLCIFHHNRVHDDGFTIRRLASGALCVADPGGNQIATEAPSADGSLSTPVRAEQPLPPWAGDYLQLDYALSVLMHRREYIRRHRTQEPGPPGVAA